MHAESNFSAVKNNLFFVVGCGRSGTTLLKTILNAHPQITIPHETFFFNMIVPKGDSDSMSRDQKIDRIVSRWWIKESGVSAQDLNHALADKEASWKNLLIALLAAQASKKEVVCFGEKTVGHLQFSKQLLDTYPGCRIIQIIRDPRAVVASFRSAKVGSNFVAKIAADWQLAYEVDQELADSTRYLRVKFEDLILHSSSTAKEICQFLKLQYNPEMLQFHKRADKGFSREQSHHENTTKEIFTSGLNTWKNKLTKNSLGLIESRLGQPMNDLGYELENVQVWFPDLQLHASALAEIASKYLVRRPMKLLKSLRIASRQSKEEKQIDVGTSNPT